MSWDGTVVRRRTFLRLSWTSWVDGDLRRCLLALKLALSGEGRRQ